MDIRPNTNGTNNANRGTPSQTLLDEFWSTVDLRIGADGGANRLLSLGLKPDFVVGDLDSLTEANRKQFQASQLHLVADQETNDVSKVLNFVIGEGQGGPDARGSDLLGLPRFLLWVQKSVGNQFVE